MHTPGRLLTTFLTLASLSLSLATPMPEVLSIGSLDDVHGSDHRDADRAWKKPENSLVRPPEMDKKDLQLDFMP